jgi:hypothetical protein
MSATEGFALEENARGSRSDARRQQVYAVRVRAAENERSKPLAVQRVNGDEERFANHIASFSKCLPHNELGEVDRAVYADLVRAIDFGRISDFEGLATQSRFRLASPLGGGTFSLAGPDARSIAIPPPPPFGSAEMAAEMLELYWMALLRDVPFEKYKDDPLAAAAAEELSQFSKSVTDSERAPVSAPTLFLADYPGISDGPRISQLVLWSFEFDGIPVEQRRATPLAVVGEHGVEFLTAYGEWLWAQRGYPGNAPIGQPPMDPQVRFIRNGRDLGWFADQSSVNTTYLNAGLLLLQFGKEALNEANPYKHTRVIGGLGSFDIAHLENLLGHSANAHHFCNQKWLHRRLRPEAFSGRVHNHLNGSAKYPINDRLLNSKVLPRIYDHNAEVNRRRGMENPKGSYLLPCLWGEGCATHPSYPQGHGTAAGIGATLLKAWFDENFVIPESLAVAPSTDGTGLAPYKYGRDGPPLTIGGELNKLAYNVTWGRNMSGVHYLSDGVAANRLGEEIAVQLLHEDRQTASERFGGFAFTRFDGTKVTA